MRENVGWSFFFSVIGRFFVIDLEWKVIYIGSAESEAYDQVLDDILVGPINVGTKKFVFQVRAFIFWILNCICEPFNERFFCFLFEIVCFVHNFSLEKLSLAFSNYYYFHLFKNIISTIFLIHTKGATTGCVKAARRRTAWCYSRVAHLLVSKSRIH